jgi:ABC-2 type transport system permease protein
MSSVYYLTLRQLSGRWRLLIMLVLAAMPVLIAAMMVSAREAPPVGAFEAAVINTMFAGSITPLIVLAIAAAAFANELEDRTLANLTLAPLPRWQIVVPKLLGSITVAAPFILASAFATSYIAFLGDPLAVTAVTVAALVCVLLYASAFTWLGLMSAQAIGIGLLYIVLWEGFFAGFVSGVRLLSIRYTAIGLMYGIDPRRFADDEHLNLAATVAVSVIVFALFVVLAIRRLRRMDVP